MGLFRTGRRDPGCPNDAVPTPRGRLRKVLLGIGIFFLVLDALAAFVWFYYGLPLRHTLSSEWRGSHADGEVW